MKLYELFKGTEYVGEFTLDEIISITGAHRSALLNSVAHGIAVLKGYGNEIRKSILFQMPENSEVEV